MSADDDDGLIRSVTPLSQEHPNEQMDVIGWGMFLTMAVVLLPLVPVFAVLWAVSKVTGR